MAGGRLDALGGAAGAFESAEPCELPSCLGGAEFVVSFDLVVWTGSRLETSFFPLLSESWLSDSSSVSFVLPLESLSASLLPSLSRSPRSLVPALSLPGPAVVVLVVAAVLVAVVAVRATVEVTAAVVDAVVAEVTPVEVACVVDVVAAVVTWVDVACVVDCVVDGGFAGPAAAVSVSANAHHTPSEPARMQTISPSAAPGFRAAGLASASLESMRLWTLLLGQR